MEQRNKTQLIQEYIDANIGKEITPTSISSEVNCTIQTVYNFIRANSSRFEKIQRGVFKIAPFQNSLFLNSETTI
jgi:Mg/Co/Ni transporter MgtE